MQYHSCDEPNMIDCYQALNTLLPCSVARGRRGVQAGIAEKKISILERALEFHPGSDRLLMALLDAVSPAYVCQRG